MVRFDQPCRRVSGALEYFSEHMQKGDYLTEHGHVLMTWEGKAAMQLGLGGTVNPLHFERLCNGQDPFTGGKTRSPQQGGESPGLLLWRASLVPF